MKRIQILITLICSLMLFSVKAQTLGTAAGTTVQYDYAVISMDSGCKQGTLDSIYLTLEDDSGVQVANYLLQVDGLVATSVSDTILVWDGILTNPNNYISSLIKVNVTEGIRVLKHKSFFSCENGLFNVESGTSVTILRPFEGGVLIDSTCYCEFPCVPPTALNDTYDVLPNNSISFNVCNNDIQGDGINPSTIEICTPITGGELINNDDCAFTFTPPLNVSNTTYEFSYSLGEADCISNCASVFIEVGNLPCPTGSFQNLDSDRCFAKGTGRTQRYENEYLDGFGNPLSSDYTVVDEFYNCNTGEILGKLEFAGDDLTTPLPSSTLDIVNNSTITGTSTTQSNNFDILAFGMSRGLIYECAIDICVKTKIESIICDPVEVQEFGKFYPTVNFTGHITAQQFTAHDATSDPNSHQHQAINSWLDDGTGECTFDNHAATALWPSLSEGTNETSTLWVSQLNGASSSGQIDVVSGNTTLIPWQGMLPPNITNPPTQSGLNYTAGVAYRTFGVGNGYVMAEGMNSDGYRGVSDAWVSSTGTGTVDGFFLFAAPANHMIADNNSVTKNSLTIVGRYAITSDGAFANQTVTSASVELIRNGTIDNVSASIPATKGVSGGTQVYSNTTIVPIMDGQTQTVTMPNIPYVFGDTYQMIMTVTTSEGLTICNIHEVEVIRRT